MTLMPHKTEAGYLKFEASLGYTGKSCLKKSLKEEKTYI
jgi:hypothetical protein